MAIDLTFEGVCKSIKSEYADLNKDIDVLFSIIFALGVTATAGPIAAVALGTTTFTTAQIILAAVNTLSSLFTVKNEGPKIVQRIIEKITNKRDNDPLEQLKRVERAYYLICFTAFFEALYQDKVLASCIKKAKMSSEEKLAVAASAVEKLWGKKDILGKDLVNCTELKLLNAKINLPHPADTFEQQEKQLLPLYEELSGIMHMKKNVRISSKH